jgi:acetoin utilization deacetylase AcuC-like enzyme/8-oxo-dGTP pyrophosphatase MutT (NUDIX family)
MKAVYAEGYRADIGTHVFPTEKYEHVIRELLARGIVTPPEVVGPSPATWEQLALVHTPAYLAKLQGGSLTFGDMAQLELPWSPEMMESFRLMVGGTIAAARLAFEEHIVVHVGGGLHHAFPGHGEGFCLFNDVAVAARVVQREGRCRRIAIVDCDVHHGNGTAAVFRGDRDVFTFSMHQDRNYPAVKPPGDLDVALEDGTTDDVYLERLEAALPAVLASDPQLVFYLAGADPYRHDQLGGLALTLDGLRARDALVLRTFHSAGVPIVITLAGGYARRLTDTVAIHVATVEESFAALKLVSPSLRSAMVRPLSTKVQHEGRVFDVVTERVRLPHGHESEMDVVRHGPSVALLAMPDPERLVLVRQYRYPVDRELWELPAGTVDEGEPAERAAARELEEEIGQSAGSLRRIGSLLATPGYCDEELIYFLASRLSKASGSAEQDPDEDIEARTFTIAEARELVRRGEITDMKTVAGLALLDLHLER